MPTSIHQELEAAKMHKTYVMYQAAIDRIITKWHNGTDDIAKYVNKMMLTQEEFGERIGVRFVK